MYQDLHSHTYYSFCGKDRPEDIAETAIRGSITLLGITDHNYGIGQQRIDVYNHGADLAQEYYRTLRRYFDHINLIKEKYRNEITILRGIELCTLDTHDSRVLPLPKGADISFFDYCLIENLDHPDSVTKGDLFAYTEPLGCKAGIAHTDLFAFLKANHHDPMTYFTKMKERGLFWEMNVNSDSTHGYREHEYVKRFFEDAEQQDIVRRSGVEISIGFDGHKVEDYLPDRVKDYCDRAESLGLRLAFS
ncbi:MAG: PHP domain-containing protein [Clostridia bacterium]|nr:PHP domain-containing protein [Clostridia bacterium]